MRIASALIAFALSALPLGLAAQETPDPAPSAAPAPLPLAKIISVDAAEQTITRRFFGRVAAKETVDLSFQVGGQILSFPVVEGQPVAKDGLIAQLDLEPFELALRQAKAQQDQTDRTLRRLSQLRGSAVSQVAVDDATTAADLAAIEVRNAERALEQATLHSPFEGLVASRQLAVFTTISPGTPIVRLHDMSELRIEIDVPEVLFQRSSGDQQVELWAEFPGIAGSFPLELREYAAETSEVGQTIRISLAMDPPEDRVILPGSSVTVKARLSAPSMGPEVPLSAIVPANDGSAQLLLFEPAGAETGTVRLIPVEITPTTRGGARIVSGLAPGQDIVASGAAQLSDGAQVRRFTGFPN